MIVSCGWGYAHVTHLTNQKFNSLKIFCLLQLFSKRATEEITNDNCGMKNPI